MVFETCNNKLYIIQYFVNSNLTILWPPTTCSFQGRILATIKEIVWIQGPNLQNFQKTLKPLG